MVRLLPELFEASVKVFFNIRKEMISDEQTALNAMQLSFIVSQNTCAKTVVPPTDPRY